MQKIKLIGLRIAIGSLALWLTFISLADTALAQTPPRPTPPPPSGSNPSVVAPTDVPVEWSLFWVFMFFFTLAMGLLFANWLVRRGTFDEPDRQL